MSQAYYIKQWKTRYERSDTRKTDYMSWFAKSTKLVGIGIGLTLAHPQNLKLLGAWTMIETLASLSAVEERGWLIRNGEPLDAEGMHALIPMIKAEDFQLALDWFVQPRINWLERLEYIPAPELTGNSPGKSPGHPTGHTAAPELTGQNSATDRQRDRQSTDRQTSEREREKKGEELDPKELRARQTAQFAAANSRLQKLEAVPRDERSEAQRAEIKKTRAVINAIQKKQAANDFTPVEETK